MKGTPLIDGTVTVTADSNTTVLKIGNADDSALLVTDRDGRAMFDLRRDGYAIGDKAKFWKVIKALFQRKGYGIAGGTDG